LRARQANYFVEAFEPEMAGELFVEVIEAGAGGGVLGTGE
jgi:hypothetical protein